MRLLKAKSIDVMGPTLWGRFKPNKDWVDEFEMFTICMLPRLDPDDEDAGSMAEE